MKNRRLPSRNANFLPDLKGMFIESVEKIDFFNIIA
jgi:hypothetical protein